MIAQTISLKIKNVRQGCPIVPYIFIIVGKMLIHIILKKSIKMEVVGDSLIREKKQ